MNCQSNQLMLDTECLRRPEANVKHECMKAFDEAEWWVKSNLMCKKEPKSSVQAAFVRQMFESCRLCVYFVCLLL